MHPADGRITSTSEAGFRAEIFDEGDPEVGQRLTELLARVDLHRNDTVSDQRDALAGLVPRPDPEVLDERSRWVYYPWRSSMVRIVGPLGFRLLRLDRNRNKITVDEQRMLATRRIGVVGLSVGHAVAHTLALEGLAGFLRLADFDEIELSNLNRIPGSLCDLGINKAVVAARRIAEIDPYLDVDVMAVALDAHSVEEFLDGLDLVAEECDSFDAKVLVRERARTRRLPVVMETSDGGVLDVERFDLEPHRPLFHGLLGEIDARSVAGLSTAEKVPLALTLLDPAKITSRAGASALEIGHSLNTWPQLGGDVALGGGSVAAAVRRLGTGLPCGSGRVRVNVDHALDTIADPLVAVRRDGHVGDHGARHEPDDPVSTFATLGDTDAVLFAAHRAPSHRNVQPWRLTVDDDGVSATLDTSAACPRLDVDRRSAAVALGAVACNMRVAASARSIFGALTTDDADGDLTVRLTFGTADGSTASDVTALLRRASARMPGDLSPLSDSEVAALRGASSTDTGVAVITDRERLTAFSEHFGRLDRQQFLTPELHTEIVEALRWPESYSTRRTGIRVDSMGLPPAVTGVLPLLGRADVMKHLADWDVGALLAALPRLQIASSSALVVVTGTEWSRLGFMRGGMTAEAVWLTATRLGLAACPVQPLTFYARDTERAEQAGESASELDRIDADIRRALGVALDTPVPMVLRVFRNPERVPVSWRRYP